MDTYQKCFKNDTDMRRPSRIRIKIVREVVGFGKDKGDEETEMVKKAEEK